MNPAFRSALFPAAAALGLSFAAFSASAETTSATDPRGRWVTASGNLEVEVAPCGANLCGTVVKVLGNRSMSSDHAQMKPVDGHPALGMTLLSRFAPVAHGEWAGEIYNRENGKTYDCRMSVSTASNPAGELQLRAYVGIPLFGKTQLWQRAQ